LASALGDESRRGAWIARMNLGLEEKLGLAI
jgi:hypothetical protein